MYVPPQAAQEVCFRGVSWTDAPNKTLDLPLRPQIQKINTTGLNHAKCNCAFGHFTSTKVFPAGVTEASSTLVLPHSLPSRLYNGATSAPGSTPLPDLPPNIELQILYESQHQGPSKVYIRNAQPPGNSAYASRTPNSCTMTTQTMKAVRVTAYHAPMEMHDIAIPTAQAPLDVIVRVGAAGESMAASRFPRYVLDVRNLS